MIKILGMKLNTDIDLMTIRADFEHPLDFFWAKDHLNRYFLYTYILVNLN